MTWNRSGIEAGDRVQQVRELTALVEAGIWFPAPTPGTLQLPITPASGEQTPSGFSGNLCICAHKLTQAHTYTHNFKK